MTVGGQWSRPAWLCSMFFFFSLVLSPYNDQGRNSALPCEFLMYITSINSIILNVSLRNEILPKKEGGAVSSKAARPHPSIHAFPEAQKRME
jgi:hypothetical protein